MSGGDWCRDRAAEMVPHRPAGAACPLQPKLILSLILRPKLQQLGRVNNNLSEVKMASSTTNGAFEQAWEEILPPGVYRAIQEAPVHVDYQDSPEDLFENMFLLATGLIWTPTWTSMIQV